jgi:hypothetical protein
LALYKLAVLAKAWIAEMSGDLPLACATLEDLGRERGFETDTDRVLSLARVYERLGTRETLWKAVRVLQFVERSFEKMSAVARLACIYRRLGEAEPAETYGRRWLASFEMRMHRLSLVEAAQVAATWYVPLEWLARGAWRDSVDGVSASTGEVSDRVKALVAFIRGDRSDARQGFDRMGELLDEKYLAELDALELDGVSSAKRFARVIDADPTDARLLGTLLRAYAVTGAPELESVAARAVKDNDAAFALRSYLRATPMGVEEWRQLATLERLLGQTEEGRQCEARAQAVAHAAERDAQPVGRVLTAAIYQFVGKSKGLIHQVWADRRPVEPGRGGFLASDDILGNVTLEMKQHVRNTFLAVREYARSRFPARTSQILDYSYTFKVTKEDEPSGGPSAGLPIALAFLSVFLQRPVPQDLAFTGVLIADSHDALVVRSVGDGAYKVKGAYHRNLRAIVMPRENRADLEASPLVPRAICDRLVRYVSTLDDAARETFGNEAFL